MRIALFAGRAGKTLPSGEYVPYSDRMQHDAMQALLREKLKLPYTVHGMRCKWRTFVTEHKPTLAEDRAAEFNLDHKVKSDGKVRETYDRARLLPERRKLLDEWSAYITATA